MKPFLNSTAGALTIALVVALLLQSISWNLPSFAGVDLSTENKTVPPWYGAASMWLFSINVTAPAFIVGLLSPIRKLVLAACFTFSFDATFSLVSNAYHLGSTTLDFAVVLDTLLFSTHLVILGVSGGALGLVARLSYNKTLRSPATQVGTSNRDAAVGP